MPNAAIPQSIRSTITSQAVRLVERVLSYSLLNSPLPFDEIEARINDPVTLDMIRALNARGVEQTSSTDVNLCLYRGAIPGLKRGIIIRVSDLPKAVFVPRRGVCGTVYTFNWGELSDPRNLNATFFPNLDGCDDAQLRAIGVWANHAVYNHRMVHMTREVVEFTLRDTFTRTVGHLHAWWPALCTLVDASEPVWRERMRNPPRRNLNIYAPKNLINHVKHTKHRELIEMTFAKANLLPVYKHPSGTPRISIMKIEKLPGDVYL